MRTGECKMCGKCCEIPTKERLEAYGDVKPETQFLDGCPHLKDGRCDDYDNRPRMCRDFPRSLLDITALPECGYKFKEEYASINNKS